jgi:predicted kinase
MSTLLVTRGLPAAGKSTWARQWVAADPATRVRVNRDDLRAMLFDTPDYSRVQEGAVTEAGRALVRALLTSHWDVVADDTNLRPRYVREWARFAAANGAEFEVVEFPISVDDSIARDATRAHPVGEAVIQRMAEKYTRKGQLLPIPDDTPETPAEPAKYAAKPDTPPAVIVDIDGTLALHNGRSPYDLTLCGNDLPNTAVIEAVQAAAGDGLEIVYCSGREDSARDTTADWIAKHVGVPGPLFMRAACDRRKDSVVKAELFNTHIRDRYDVRWVFDDRQQVVDMWRSLGLTVFQVAKGDF